MSEIVWDDETQAYVKAEDLKLRKLKEQIINELLDQLQNNYVINITIDMTKGQGQGQIKKKQ
jgi:uncharacterized protein YqfB (UPF0267 family)